MDKNKVHISIAEIYKATDNIKDMANSWAAGDRETPEYLSIYRLCDYIQILDKILHDEIFPKCQSTKKENKK